ncbi:helix-turn-helix domain-containing protein [Antrihabitans sp. YC2-6]|uniref:helix-turn-helix domain-containing protein n=1 Tax=Antrihabitans sp. YC2-6 TaxID=2799498 RepID=UPI0018F50959|nr:helix-turn-helix domain-containing protein [Antrihabitans sp. YC2-6]MBJ8348025.1 transcriptional regulator [Antrihabitans sp. YC2-6]
MRGNPWVALRPGDDVAALASRVHSAHQMFVEHADYVEVRSVVRDSWLRSRSSGVDPDRSTGSSPLSGLELERYRSTHPMALVRPVVRKLLVEDAADTGLLIAISDAKGRLLWVEGDTAAKDRALSMNFAEGADWSEGSAGTNAPGTALALDHSVQIFGAEHFSRVVHEWSCTAAPVHDPNTGRILGAIDITGGPRVAIPEVLSLIRATVAAAESELRFHVIGQPLDSGTRLELLGARPALVRDGDRIPLSRRHAEILVLLIEHPEGMSGEHIAVLLDENELDPVTVRAEISRLRKILGADVVGSRPYRLHGHVASDVGEVRAGLERGDARAALGSYSGPLLPFSDAPGVYRVREELRTRVQAALLRSGDASLLRRWTESADGRDDSAVWSAYLSTLDRGSSLYAQVKAQIALLDRELG